METWTEPRDVRLYLQNDLVRAHAIHGSPQKLLCFHRGNNRSSASLERAKRDKPVTLLLLDLARARGPCVSGSPEELVSQGEQIQLRVHSDLGHRDVPLRAR